MNFIDLTNEAVESLDFDIRDASNLLWQDIAILADWVALQDEEMFVDLSLQEVLNLYRISHEYEDFELFFEEDPEGALIAYNYAVNTDNYMEAH